MLLSLIAATALVAPAGDPTPDTTDHGKLAWFDGTYEAALAKAATEERLVFIDFWTDWCVWCKRLDADVFSQDSVATAMDDIICLSVDAESKTGAPIAKRFNVTGFPTLLVLNSDGSVRDSIAGYMPPDDFIAEIERIERDEGTLSAMLRKVEANPEDLEARFEYALKLQSVGDEQGHAAQLAAIRERDPEGKSTAMRKLRLEELAKAIDTQARSQEYPDLEPLLAFLEQETDSALLFDGYRLAWTVEEFNTRLAALGDEPAKVEEHRARQLDMERLAWKHVPADMQALYGNQVAWMAWERQGEIPEAYKQFALEVARVASKLEPENASIHDTLACVLFMNGEREAALEQVRRCLELEPENEVFIQRLQEFGAEG